MSTDSRESGAGGTAREGRNQRRTDVVICFPLQPFVPRRMCLNTVLLKEGLASQLGLGITKRYV